MTFTLWMMRTYSRMMGRIFQPFRRAVAAQAGGTPGWGLGLAQVQAIAEAHGGGVGIDSSPDDGTTFTLDLIRDVRELK